MCRFLLVSLKIEAILGEVTIGQRRKKLEEMARGNGLSDAYTTTLTRLKGQKGNKSVLGWKVLMWVLYAERPLRAKELCHALGVEIGSADLDPNNVPTIRTLLASCLGLVTVEVSSSTVRLVHFTLQEHLLSDPTLFHNPHSTIAEVCLTYLNFGCISALPPTFWSAPQTMPLVEYASCYWGSRTKMELTENVKILALKLLDRFDKHISAQLLLLHYNENRGSGPYFPRWGGPRGFTGLHGVSFLGIVEIVTNVLEVKKWDINASDCMGMTALIWAARNGYKEVVKILLEQGDVNPDQPDTTYGRTPLLWAAESGHEGIVKMLLEREDVNPDRADTFYGRTPLSWAAQRGHEEVVKMFWEREGIDPDQADTKYGRTPLSWAAESGTEGVVKMLLEREDVNPDQPDTNCGQTPLSWAAKSGNEGVVKMLLEREDVNPDQPDTNYGQTPLSLAAENGHHGVVKMLLEREDVNPERADTKYGWTPLRWAAASRHEGVAILLLERKDVDPNQKFNRGRTSAFTWTAQNGYEGVVKVLLEREGVNPDQPDTEYGRTPLAWAAKNGHGGMVKILLERQDVCATALDYNKETPLSLALSGGHDEVVRILRDNANSHTTDRSGHASLSPPAGRGDERAVDMESRIYDSNISTIDLNTRPPSPPADPDAREGVSDLENPLLLPADSDLSSPKPPKQRRFRTVSS